MNEKARYAELLRSAEISNEAMRLGRTVGPTEPKMPAVEDGRRDAAARDFLRRIRAREFTRGDVSSFMRVSAEEAKRLVAYMHVRGWVRLVGHVGGRKTCVYRSTGLHSEREAAE